MTDIDALLAPPTPAAALALEAAREWMSPALVAHSLRSWAWAVALAERIDLPYDAELLFVAAMLHDAGLAPHFDAVAVPFEEAGGAVAAVFAAGAGWAPVRRGRVREVIERHMWRAVDPAVDAEGHLLEMATSLDVRGSGASDWDPALLRSVTERLPRSGFSDEFGGSIAAQAARKPECSAVRLHAAGGAAAGAVAWAALLP